MTPIRDIEEARAQRERLLRAWWNERKRPAGNPSARDILQEYEDQAIRQFAMPDVPGCRQCELYSVFGGPDHHPSPMCQSGKHPHCTCDACF